jgi:hypothetical protein
MLKIHPKDKYIQKIQAWWHTNSYEEHVCNSRTTPWNSRKEGKKKRMLEHK